MIAVSAFKFLKYLDILLGKKEQAFTEFGEFVDEKTSLASLDAHSWGEFVEEHTLLSY